MDGPGIAQRAPDRIALSAVSERLEKYARVYIAYKRDDRG